jgi:5S rRNA maturation endonuclease (ribonuclease M5)
MAKIKSFLDSRMIIIFLDYDARGKKKKYKKILNRYRNESEYETRIE